MHDSYWTHACHVDVMSKLLRDKFVELHARPLLAELREELQRKHPELNLPPLPEALDSTRQFDLELVKESDYFFS